MHTAAFLFLVLLSLSLAGAATPPSATTLPSARKIATSGLTRVVNLPIDMIDLRPVTTRIRIGSPPREVVMLLDFQSDVSGVWNIDLMRTSHTYVFDTPVARDAFGIGPYTYMFQVQSVVNALETAARSGQPPPYYPQQPSASVGGWLAMGPRSELRMVWNSFRINKHKLTMWSWLPSGRSGGDMTFLTKEERTFPNIPLKLHAQSAWWHRGYLMSPRQSPVRVKGLARSRHTEDLTWLRAHHAENITFVLFGNDSITLLPQRVYDSLFFRANVYRRESVPSEIRLAPGLRLPIADWFHEETFSHIRWLDIGALPAITADALVGEHPLPNCSASDLAVLSLHATLRRFEVVINSDTGDMALIHTPVKDHLSGWQLGLLIVLIVLFIVMFLVRSVFLRLPTYTPGVPVRAYNATRYLTIGFRAQGFWFLMFVQAISAVFVLVAYWCSEKLPAMRRDGGNAQLIYCISTVFLHVNVLVTLVNLVLQVTSCWLQGSLDELHRLRARLFIISRGLFTQSLLLAVWIVLMDRTAIDTTNLAAALFSLLMVLFSIIDALMLMDRITYTALNPRVQLWPSLKVYQHSRRRIPYGERITLIYAVAVQVWLLAYMIWTVYFSATLQLYEQLLISMSTVTTATLHMLCWAIVVHVCEYGVRIASTLVQVNHVSGS